MNILNSHLQLFQNITLSSLVDEINELLPEHTYLRNYAFTESGVQISVDFESLAVISQYVERLNNSPILAIFSSIAFVKEVV